MTQCTKCDGTNVDFSSQGHFYFCPDCKAEYHYKENK